MDGHLDEPGRVIGDVPGHAVWKALRHPLHLITDALDGSERIGVRGEEGQDKRGRPAFEPAFQVIGLGPQLHPRHIFHTHHGPVRKGPDDHVLEFLHLGHPAARDHGEGQLGSLRRRLPPDRAGGKVTVLLVDNARDIGRRDIELRHPDRIKNKPHAVVLRAEHEGITHSGQKLETVHHTEDGVIGQIELIVARIVGVEGDDGDEVRRQFFDRDPPADDLRRKLRLRQLLAVLRLDLRDVRVRADLEREPDSHVTVVGAGGVVVEEIVDAGELHFDGPRHRLGDHFRAGAGVVGVDLYHGRRDLRKLGDGQDIHGCQAHDHDDDGDNRREDRPFDEKGGAHLAPSVPWPGP